MYIIELKIQNNKMSIPMDKHCNAKKDIHLFTILKPKLYDIYSFMLNNNVFNGVTISLLDDQFVLTTKTIVPKKTFVCYLDGFKPDSNLQIEKLIEELFDRLDAYEITILDNEINEVYLNGKNIDVNWFIENVYYNNSQRYYRKISTFSKLKVFVRDVK